MTMLLIPNDFNGLRAIDSLPNGRFIVTCTNTILICSFTPDINISIKPIPLISKLEINCNKEKLITINNYYDNIEIEEDMKAKMFVNFYNKNLNLDYLTVYILRIRYFEKSLKNSIATKRLIGVLLSNLHLFIYEESNGISFDTILDYNNVFNANFKLIKQYLNTNQCSSLQSSEVYNMDIYFELNLEGRLMMAVAHDSFVVIWSFFNLADLNDWSVSNILIINKKTTEVYFLPNKNEVFLCLSFVDGSAVIYNLRENVFPSNNQSKSISLYEDFDQMPVVNFKLHSEKLYASKAQFLLSWNIDFKDNISIYGFKITCFDTAHHITNICFYKEDIYISKPDYLVSVDSKNLDKRKLIETAWNSKFWKLNGLMISLNGAYMVTAVSPAIGFTTKEKIDKIRLHLTPLLKLDVAVQCLLSNNEPLPHVYDLLFIVRNAIYTKFWPRQILELMEDVQSFSNLSLQKLKLIRYFYLLKESSNKKDEKINKNYIDDIERQIMCYFLKKTLENITNTKSENLNQQENASILLMQHYLNLNKNILEVSNLSVESCIVCDQKIPFCSLNKSKCEKGHIFGRCCFTLLTCHETPYRKCSVCPNIALAQTNLIGSFFQSISSDFCNMCDGVLLTAA